MSTEELISEVTNPEARREELREKIAEGEARLEERTFAERATEAAVTAKDGFQAFAREHPLATVMGGLAVGVLISGLFKRSPTRKFGKKAAGLASIGTELALTYALQALDTANSAGREAGRIGADRLEDIGDAMSDSARHLRRDAGYFAVSAADKARSRSRDIGKIAGRLWRDRVH